MFICKNFVIAFCLYTETSHQLPTPASFLEHISRAESTTLAILDNIISYHYFAGLTN